MMYPQHQIFPLDTFIFLYVNVTAARGDLFDSLVTDIEYILLTKADT
jgi:hypothetical protein